MTSKFIKKLLLKISPPLAKFYTEYDEWKMTSTWVPVGHFYSPIAPLSEIEAGLANSNGKDTTFPGVNLNDKLQLEFLEKFSHHYGELPFKDEKTEELRYFFQNDAYSYSDGICLYSMIRELKPKRIVEVGSGYSSALILDTNSLFFDNKINCTFIDPYTELLNSLLSDDDRANVEIIDKRVQDVDIEKFSSLEENDILFIDSTHVSRCFSDVNREFFEILPSLKKGVYIHFHDIFYPFEYPEYWLKERRSWNELYLLRAFLQYNDSFEIVFFNNYLNEKYGAKMAEKLPLTTKNPGGSIWLRKIK